MATRWIDFRALKEQISIRDVLEHYGVLSTLQEKKPGRLVGPCPVHGGTNSNSFNVDVERGLWNCFSDCKSTGKSGGNVLDLVVRLEGCSIREAGEKLCDWFGLSFSRNGTNQNAAKVSEKSSPKAAAAHPPAETVVNPPLERPLSNLKPNHEYIQGRGIAVETAEHFGIGYASRGMMRGRIAIPIHDALGNLVAYAGRAVTEELASEKGKYRLPQNFRKSHVLYNLAPRARRTGTLIVVEGFFDVMKLYQARVENVVALMGSTLSNEQAELLVDNAERLVLMFDGDNAGREGERACYRMLRPRVFLKSVHLTDGEQPDMLSEDRLRELLS